MLKNSILTAIVLIGISCGAYAQCVFMYQYDEKGNRVSRGYVGPDCVYTHRPSAATSTVTPTLKEANGKAKLKIMPNPTTDAVVVSLPTAVENGSTLCLLDLQGKVLLIQPANPNNSLSLGNYPAGIYFLQCRTAEGVIQWQEKVIKIQ